MNKPELSVVIPIYNAARFVEAMLDAVLSQTYTDFELLLIDDGSTDSSLNIIKKYAEKDQRVNIFSQKNQGPSAARNLGIAKASGEYIMFLDADDTIEIDYFEIMINQVVGVDLAVAGLNMVFLKTGKTKQFLPESVLLNDDRLVAYVLESIGQDGLLYSPWNKIFRRTIIQKHQLQFDLSIKNGEDLMFNLDYLTHCQTLKICPIAKYNYLQRGEGINLFAKTAATTFNDRQKMFQTLEKFLTGVILSEEQAYNLEWIRYRWFLSSSVAVCASNLSRQSKNQLLLEGLKTFRKQHKKIGLNPGLQINLTRTLLSYLIRLSSKWIGFLKVLSRMVIVGKRFVYG